MRTKKTKGVPLSTSHPAMRKLRAVIEAQVEHLIAVLDQIDGDPDMEPVLSQGTGSDHWNDQSAHWLKPALEGDLNEDREEDMEGSGGIAFQMDQRAWHG